MSVARHNHKLVSGFNNIVRTPVLPTANQATSLLSWFLRLWWAQASTLNADVSSAGLTSNLVLQLCVILLNE